MIGGDSVCSPHPVWMIGDPGVSVETMKLLGTQQNKVRMVHDSQKITLKPEALKDLI